jgi:hypothetical protein
MRVRLGAGFQAKPPRSKLRGGMEDRLADDSRPACSQQGYVRRYAVVQTPCRLNEGAGQDSLGFTNQK